MSTKQVIARNALWSSSGLAANMVTGFVVAPFLVHRLGQTTYGLWILIASFTSYFGLLDLGVRGSVGRNLAFRYASGDREGANAVLSLAAAFLGAAGLLALLGTAGVSLVFTRLFEVPPGQAESARWALRLVGLNLALWLPLNIFDATLWATQRFDRMNAVDIAAALTRTFVTFALIGSGGGLVALAWVNLLCMAGGQFAKAVIVFRTEPGTRIGPGHIRPGVARELFGYSTWYSLLGVARTVTKQIGPLLVGAWMGVQLVTPYAVASRLVSYAGELILACTGVLTPVTTALHARGDHERQRTVFVEGGKLCLALSLFFATAFLALGRPLIETWMGPELAYASQYLSILALGELLPMSQSVTSTVILGVGGHRPLACANLAEGVVGVALCWALSGRYGLLGICAGLATSAALSRGVFQLFYGCRLVGVSPWRFARQAVLPAAAAAAIPGLALAAAVASRPPRSVPWFLAYGTLYAVGYGLACALLLGGNGRLALVRAGLARKLSGPGITDN